MIAITKKLVLGEWTPITVTSVTKKEGNFNGNATTNIWIYGTGDDGIFRSAKINATNEENLGIALSGICAQLDEYPDALPADVDEAVDYMASIMIGKPLKIISIAISIPNAESGLDDRVCVNKFDTDLNITEDMKKL